MTGRLPALLPDALDADQRELYAALTGGPRGTDSRVAALAADGALTGPFNAMLYHPRVGGPLQEVGARLRYASVLPDRARELSVLMLAAHARSQYEWFAHCRIGAAAGVTEEQIEQIRRGAEPVLDPVTDPVDAAVVAATAELLATDDLADASYAAAVAALGETAVVELTALVGYYRLIATQLRVFRVPLPDGVAEATFGA